MNYTILREKYADLIERQKQHVSVRSVVRDGLAQMHGLPVARGLAESVTLGRAWFSVTDATIAPFFRVRRFEA